MAEGKEAILKSTYANEIFEYEKRRALWIAEYIGYSEVFVETKDSKTTKMLRDTIGVVELIELAGNYSTLQVSKNKIESVYEMLESLEKQGDVIGFDWVQFVGKTNLDKSVARISGNPDVTNARLVPPDAGEGVVIGIVDYGIDFTMDDFRWPDGKNKGKTRIDFLWDQSLEPEKGGDVPSKYRYGVEYSASDINGALEEWDKVKGLKWDNLRRNKQAVIRHNSRNPDFIDIDGHGTHVAGIAAGNGMSFDEETWNEIPADKRFRRGKYVGVAPGSTLVFVSLPRQDIHKDIKAARGTLANSCNLAHAVAYCFEKAGNRPCVVNLSMGFYGGGHDGNMAVERVIDALVNEKPGRAVVVAAGNAGTLARHAGGLLKEGGTAELIWQIGWKSAVSHPGAMMAMKITQDDPTPYEVEVWYSKGSVLEFELVPPNGADAFGPIKPGERRQHTFPTGGENVMIRSDESSPWKGDSCIHIELSSQKGSSGIRYGEWKIKLTAKSVGTPLGDAGKNVRFDAWIEKTVPGYKERPLPEERYSRFVKIEFTPGDKGRDEDSCTLNTPTTARCAITVAAHKNSSPLPASGTAWVPAANEIWEKSSYGPTRDGRRKPLLAAPGSAILSSDVYAGEWHDGQFHSVRVAMEGTSMAAPHVTGVVARLLSLAKGKITAKKIREILMNTAVPPNNALPTSQGKPVWDRKWGYGMVRADLALAELQRQMENDVHTQDIADTDWGPPPDLPRLRGEDR